MFRRTLPFFLIIMIAACGKDSPSSPTPQGQGKVISVTGDLNFGSVTVGTTADRTFIVSNVGSEPISVTGMSIASASNFAATFTSGPLAPGAGQTVTLRFTPTEAKSYSATLRVNGDHTSGTSTIAVTAAGTLEGLRFPLTGAVRFNGIGVASATVRVLDGPDAGRSTLTGPDGRYELPDLSAGTIRVRAEAAVGQPSEQSIVLDGPKAFDFTLRPTPAIIDEELTGSISGGDATCSDGIFTKPCKRHTLFITNPGTVEATLLWDGSSNDLDLTFWVNGSLVASSRGVRNEEKISATVTGTGTYQLRVTYYEGATVTNYRLRVRRPN
jgi:hypothetical protein